MESELKFNMKRLIRFQIKSKKDTDELYKELEKIETNLSDRFRFLFYRVALNVLQFFSTDQSSILSLFTLTTPIFWLNHTRHSVITGGFGSDKVLKFDVLYSDESPDSASYVWNESLVTFVQSNFDESPEIVGTDFQTTFPLFVKYHGTYLKRVSRNKKLVPSFSFDANQGKFTDESF